MLKVIALVIPLGLDAFAVSAALGIRGLTPQERVRVSILFPTFEALAPLLGLAVGAPLGQAIGVSADYLAIGVLIAFGGFTLLRGEQDEQEQVGRLASVHGVAVIALGLTIALDEVAIGFTIGLLGLPLVPVLVLIAVQAVAFSQLGLRLGARLSERMRENAERLASLALIGIGFALLVEKLLA